VSHCASYSAVVKGNVNTTCDGWQAENVDGYFAVMGHWIEEKVPMQWEIENSLLGFTKINNTHSGKWLGGALFKILDCVGITHKVSSLWLTMIYYSTHRTSLGHVTCDNATNNGTTLQEFAHLYEAKYNKVFPWCQHKIK
jgi:hypothetical protein